MPDKSQSKVKTKKILLTIILIGVSSLLLFVAYQAFMYVNPMARINFKAFVPAGKEIQDQQLIISTYYTYWGGKSQDTFIFPKVSINYESDGKNVRLKKSSGSEYDCGGNNFAKKCAIKTTSNGQKYRYLTGVQTGQKEVVTFNKDGTEINIVALDSNKLFVEAEWNEFIDSLQPTGFENLPLLRRPHSPV